MKEIKKKEKENFIEKGKTYYNIASKNCQHFACGIEKTLFDRIKSWHSFNYYIDDFFKTFFPNKNINKLKLKMDEVIRKENENLYKKNLEIIEDYGKKIKNKLSMIEYFNVMAILNDDLKQLFIK